MYALLFKDEKSQCLHITLKMQKKLVIDIYTRVSTHTHGHAHKRKNCVSFKWFIGLALPLSFTTLFHDPVEAEVNL